MTLNRNVTLVLISTASTDPTDPPVICEYPTDTYPPDDEADLWRPATDDEYQAYLTYWDAWYAENAQTWPGDSRG